MTMTDTAALIYGVQYQPGGEDEPIVKVVDAFDLGEELDDIRSRFGVTGKVVTKPAAWVVEEKLTGDHARRAVENVIAELSEGERTYAKAIKLLRPFGAALLTDAEAEKRTAAKLPWAEECTWSGWLERAVNLHEECALISDGLAKDVTGEVGADYDNHIAVLAGLADHIPNGCLKCSVVSAPAKKAEVAA